MKKISADKPESPSDGLLREHEFDLGKAKPMRHAAHQKRRFAVVLDEDLAEVFATAESVNRVLRAFLETMPRDKG